MAGKFKVIKNPFKDEQGRYRLVDPRLVITVVILVLFFLIFKSIYFK